MSAKSGRAWKNERASVNTSGGGGKRSRSNKYRQNDNDSPSGSRSRIWVGGYTRSDGTHVDGYYRSH